MWLFRRKKIIREPQRTSPPCSHCGSTNTRLILYHGTDHPDYVRMWRGQRSLTYRCFDCGLDFYEEGKRQGYVNPELSTETIMRYMLIVRSGMAAESILSEDSEHNRKLMQELTPLFLYGTMGKPGK